MNESDVAALVREQTDEWEALTAILDAYPSESLHDPETPEWTSRDVYAHLARWMQFSLDNFKGFLDGQEVHDLGTSADEMNARWKMEDSHLSLDEARILAQTTFERWLEGIKSVPSERWNDEFVKFVCIDGSYHYRTHMSYIVTDGF